MEQVFQDRAEAGRVLAGLLSGYADRPDVLVLALPRGGVPVGAEVAGALHAPLDVLVVRKLGVPGHEELAMGAIASGGARVTNHEVVQGLRIPDSVIEAAATEQQRELERRERLYRGDRPFPDVKGRTVLLVDDGLATGSTMRAAIAALRGQGPARIVVAVPTAPRLTCAEMRAEADACVCASIPDWFYAVGQSYVEFPQVSDEEVRLILASASGEPVGAPG
jgi:predicted phosphoribosyltransferase